MIKLETVGTERLFLRCKGPPKIYTKITCRGRIHFCPPTKEIKRKGKMKK